MAMNTEASFEKYIHELENEEQEQLGLILMMIPRWPTCDPRMLAYLQACLEDTRPTLIYFKPFKYAEVRYAAAQALATEQAVQGIIEGVVVPFSVIPLTWTEMGHLAREAGLNFYLDPLELLPILMEKKLVPRRNHVFPPRIPHGWLDKGDKQD